MSKTYLYFLGLVFFVRCTTPSNDFKEYVSQIPPVSLPITFKTNDFPKSKNQNHITESLFNKYKYVDAARVFGIVFNNDKTIAIAYTVNGDVLTPVIVTYDKKGDRIDSINLFKNASGPNLESETYVTSTIYPDNTIQEIDSHSSWKLNENGDDRLQGSEVIRVDTIKYVLTEAGKIISVNPNRK